MLDAGIGTVVHENQNYFFEQAGGVRLETGGGRCAREERGERREERGEQGNGGRWCKVLWCKGLGGFFGDRGSGWFLAGGAEA